MVDAPGRTGPLLSVEKLAVEIRHVGTANNLVSAFVTIHYNNSDFYEQCKIEGC